MNYVWQNQNQEDYIYRGGSFPIFFNRNSINIDLMLTLQNFKLLKMKIILFVTILLQVLGVYISESGHGKLNL